VKWKSSYVLELALQWNVLPCYLRIHSDDLFEQLLWLDLTWTALDCLCLVGIWLAIEGNGSEIAWKSIGNSTATQGTPRFLMLNHRY